MANPPLPPPYEYNQWKRKELKREQKRLNNNDARDSSDEDDEMNYEPTPIEKPAIKQNPLPVSTSSSYSALNSIVSNSGNSMHTGTIRITASAAPTVAKLLNNQQTPKADLVNVIKTCSICSKQSVPPANGVVSYNDVLICCSSCSRYSHPNCLELNPKLVNWQCIRQYKWECMECKKCSICSNPHDDDKMMFCDRCDRGFHTYCVGVKEVPSGAWLCKTCSLCYNEKQQIYEEKIIQNAMNKVNAFEPEPIKLMDGHVILNNINNSPLIKSAIKTSSITPNIHKSSSNPGTLDQSNTVPKARGRGRPPGSLNKPKDPNSPKKSAKSATKIKNIDFTLQTPLGMNENSSLLNQDEFDMDDEENSLHNGSYLNYSNNMSIPRFDLHTNNSFHY